LSYPPDSLVESPAGIREDEAAEPRGAPIRVEPFKDLRDDPSSLGGEHHVLTSGCAGSTHGYRRLRTEDEAARWVTDALKHDLERAGYAPTPGDAAPIVVSGGIIRADCANRGSESGSLSTVILSIRVRRGSEVLIDDWFQGRVPPAGSSLGLAEALSEASRSFLRRLKERTRTR
jgi:hypothetical protein